MNFFCKVQQKPDEILIILNTLRAHIKINFLMWQKWNNRKNFHTQSTRFYAIPTQSDTFLMHFKSKSIFSLSLFYSLQLQWTCTSMQLQFGSLQAIGTSFGWSVRKMSAWYCWTLLPHLQGWFLPRSSESNHTQKGMHTWVHGN